MKLKKVLRVLIFFQIIFLAGVVFYIYLTGSSRYRSSNASISPINKISKGNEKEAGIKNFYDLKKNNKAIIDLSFMGREYEYEVVNHTNSDGMNQSKDFPVEKPKNVIRIMAIGDSFTYGLNVNTEDNYPSQLQKILDTQCKGEKKYEVFNLGVPGYDFEFTIARLKMIGVKYKPDLVVWLLIDNDMLRLTGLINSRSLAYLEDMKRTGEYQRAVARGNLYPHFIKANDEIVKELGEEKILSIQLKYLNSLSSIYTGQLALLTFPNTTSAHKKFLNDFTKNRLKTTYTDEVTNIFTSKLSLPDHHPSIEGHKRIAEDVFKYLKDRKLIACN